MKIAVLTDNAAIIPQSKQKLNIKVLPLPLMIEGKTYYENNYEDRIHLELRLQKSKTLLTSGQVSLTTIHQVMDELRAEGYTDVICVHVDNSISGLGNNLQSFSLGEHQIKLHLFDSHSFGVAEGQLAQVAARLAQKNSSIEQILLDLKKLRTQLHTIVILKNLKHISKTGYVKNGVSPVKKTLFKPKTLMKFTSQGQLEVCNTYSRYSRLFREIRRRIMPAYQEQTGQLVISIMAVRTQRNDKIILHLTSGLRRIFPVAKVRIYELPYSIIAQTGTDSFVISWG